MTFANSVADLTEVAYTVESSSLIGSLSLVTLTDADTK